MAKYQRSLTLEATNSVCMALCRNAVNSLFMSVVSQNDGEAVYMVQPDVESFAAPVTIRVSFLSYGPYSTKIKIFGESFGEGYSQLEYIRDQMKQLVEKIRHQVRKNPSPSILLNYPLSIKGMAIGQDDSELLELAKQMHTEYSC